MNIVIIVALASFILFEVLILTLVLKALRNSSERRDLSLAQLDKERQEILNIQLQLRSEAESAQQLSRETLGKLQSIGLQANAEWTEMTGKIDEVISEVEQRCGELSQNVLKDINKKQLECRKIIESADRTLRELRTSLESAKKVSALLTSQGGIEEVLREIQMEKYQEARRRLLSGASLDQVSASLGLSRSEISLLSHTLAD